MRHDNILDIYDEDSSRSAIKRLMGRIMARLITNEEHSRHDVQRLWLDSGYTCDEWPSGPGLLPNWEYSRVD